MKTERAIQCGTVYQAILMPEVCESLWCACERERERGGGREGGREGERERVSVHVWYVSTCAYNITCM